MIGLGKMGLNMALRLVRGGHRVAAFDVNAEAVRAAAAAGAEGIFTLDELTAALAPPRAVWVMVPAGEITEETIHELSWRLAAGDTIVDGGNSWYRDSVRRAAALQERGLNFVDAGTSGGIWGLAEGYSLMIGGDEPAVARLRPVFETLAPAPDRGWGRVGPGGAGHFAKMVHNGIEYGLMQAYAEGFSLLARKTEFGFDLPQVAEIWRHGSVVRSWLLDLTARALAGNPRLEGIASRVADSGEGRWTVQEAVELGCPLPVITLALQNRFRSREDDPFGDRLLSALRNQFGGHAATPGPPFP
jgi:6-phosphogluconate dehydrogenase